MTSQQRNGSGAYPRVSIDLGAIEGNARAIGEICAASGISLTGVVKGSGGLPRVAAAMARGGCSALASSRLAQLRRLREAGVGLPLGLLRVPGPERVSRNRRDRGLEPSVRPKRARPRGGRGSASGPSPRRAPDVRPRRPARGMVRRGGAHCRGPPRRALPPLPVAPRHRHEPRLLRLDPADGRQPRPPPGHRAPHRARDRPKARDSLRRRDLEPAPPPRRRHARGHYRAARRRRHPLPHQRHPLLRRRYTGTAERCLHAPRGDRRDQEEAELPR